MRRKQDWKQKYNLKDWWRSVGFIGVLVLIEMYASNTPGPHR